MPTVDKSRPNSASSGVGAGAPDRKFWELPCEQREPLERAFAEWQAKWGHALDLGGFGDLRELRDALNAAFPKA